MKVVIVDNYDSFTYNLRQLIEETGADVEVVKNDAFEVDQLQQYDKIVFSPGPGLPEEAGRMKEVIGRYAGQKPMLGICLGEQAIGEVFGAKLKHIDRVMHGMQSMVKVVARDELYEGLGSEFAVGRYHSWIVDTADMPHCLEVTAVSEEGQVMSLRHREYKIWGMQFHPESILTPGGKTMIENFINCQ